MTRKKTKYLTMFFLFAALIMCALVATINKSPLTANAATTPLYQVAFEYTHFYHYNTSKTARGSGNTTETPYLQSTRTGTAKLSITLYGSGYIGNHTLVSGGAVNSNTINIAIISGFTYNNGVIYNSSWQQVGSIQDKKGSVSGLADGVYHVEIIASSPGWNSNSRTYERYSLECKFDFVVDTLAPAGTLYGGTTAVPNHGKTNENYVKFVAKDNASGIYANYVKKPGQTEFKTFYASDTQWTEEGTFEFYCVDNANNKSSVYTITRDSTAPALSCAQSSFFSTANRGFTVLAKDSLSEAKLYYKTPSMSDYAQTGDSYTVPNTAKDGKYYFYAEDELSNRSEEVWIELKIAAPVAEIVRSDTDNGVYATWADNSVASLDGRTYRKGTWIYTEGNHTLMLRNVAGRVSIYKFSVGHDYKPIGKVESTCTKSGYTIFQCTSCSDRYNSMFLSPKGHRYEIKLIEPTCTERGALRHICSVCGDYYDTEGEPARGHQYVEATVAATCTTSGYLSHTCSVCGFDYQTDVILPSGHNYIRKLIKPGDCINKGERKHTCETCGDTYTTEIPALGHQYEISDVDMGGGKTLRTYVCSVCGDSYTQDLGDQYEKVTSYVEYLFNLYSPYMIWAFLATAGVWSIVLGVMIIIAHKNEDKEKAKKMVTNYVIGLVAIFSILVACPYLVKGIAALIA